MRFHSESKTNIILMNNSSKQAVSNLTHSFKDKNTRELNILRVFALGIMWIKNFLHASTITLYSEGEAWSSRVQIRTPHNVTK